tara:strand:- start:804 stop:980 length:177 start_codon:yes stop_codon:yes gene_type:complete
MFPLNIASPLSKIIAKINDKEFIDTITNMLSLPKRFPAITSVRIFNKAVNIFTISTIY